MINKNIQNENLIKMSDICHRASILLATCDNNIEIINTMKQLKWSFDDISGSIRNTIDLSLENNDDDDRIIRDLIKRFNIIDHDWEYLLESYHKLIRERLGLPVEYTDF